MCERAIATGRAKGCCCLADTNRPTDRPTRVGLLMFRLLFYLYHVCLNFNLCEPMLAVVFLFATFKCQCTAKARLTLTQALPHRTAPPHSLASHGVIVELHHYWSSMTHFSFFFVLCVSLCVCVCVSGFVRCCQMKRAKDPQLTHTHKH